MMAASSILYTLFLHTCVLEKPTSSSIVLAAGGETAAVLTEPTAKCTQTRSTLGLSIQGCNVVDPVLGKAWGQLASLLGLHWQTPTARWCILHTAQNVKAVA